MQQGFGLRTAREDDAEAVARLAAEFVAYLAALGDPDPRGITAAEYLRDGFGDRAAFAGFVAEDGAGVIGYLLYHDGYDVDRRGRVMYVADLFITEHARRHGVGRALMERARAECHTRGGRALLWTVYPANAAARSFYERLGARPTTEQLMSWSV
jgi:GNAT superfamily N-acetyltransferase